MLHSILQLTMAAVVLRSASNYLLGLTPVQLPAFLLGTVAGMSVWSVVYASLGGASRVLLNEGTDLGVLLTGMVWCMVECLEQQWWQGASRIHGLLASMSGYCSCDMGWKWVQHSACHSDSCVVPP